MIDRAEVSRALAKAIAYKQCGKDRAAEEWAIRLIRLLECSSILKPTYNGEWMQSAMIDVTEKD